jgi:predicted nucleic acid-binding protein
MMQILRTAQDLSAYLRSTNCKPGCLADTSFLYGLAYRDDRLFEKANDVLDLLSEKSVPIYTNVISRMEFVDLILRKQLTAGCVALFNELERSAENQELFNLLKKRTGCVARMQ